MHIRIVLFIVEFMHIFTFSCEVNCMYVHMYSKYIGMLYMSVYYIQIFVLCQCTYIFAPNTCTVQQVRTYVLGCVTLLVIGTGGVCIKQAYVLTRVLT